MGNQGTQRPGSIVWHDLTVRDADKIREFYGKVIGWGSQPFEGDYNMLAQGDAKPVAGICHARGSNKNLPAQWLLYVTVANLDRSVQLAKDGGGSIVDGPRDVGNARFCVIRDPAGAVIALYESGKQP